MTVTVSVAFDASAVNAMGVDAVTGVPVWVVLLTVAVAFTFVAAVVLVIVFVVRPEVSVVVVAAAYFGCAPVTPPQVTVS
ncbi:hypothetical protein O3730_004772, partial [Salmonella enterica]|nr:hypothetical protein [Salmonella enterica]EKG6436470.1 hypothetical protein [Salmonella enterica]